MCFSSFGLDRGPVQYQIWPHNCSTHKMRSAREEFRRKFKILWIKIICLITKLTLTKINIQSTKPCCQPEKPVAPATFFFFFSERKALIILRSTGIQWKSCFEFLSQITYAYTGKNRTLQEICPSLLIFGNH